MKTKAFWIMMNIIAAVILGYFAIQEMRQARWLWMVLDAVSVVVFMWDAVDSYRPMKKSEVSTE